MINLAIIPARGGSKRIPRKNIALLAGKPLIYFTIAAAQQSKIIDRVIVSTEDGEIAAISRSFQAEVQARSDHLATDAATSIDVVRDVVDRFEESDNVVVGNIIILQPTSPLRTHLHIDRALNLFLLKSTDSLVSVVRVPHAFQPSSLMTLRNGYLKPYLVDKGLPDHDTTANYLYARNGAAIYICTRECLMEKHSLYGETTIPFEMNPDVSIDIDEFWDLQLCEMIMKNNVRP